MSSLWVTHKRAAEILGVNRSTVGKVITRGDLTSRGYTGRGNGCLHVEEVVFLAEQRRCDTEAREERRRARVSRKTPDPPDDAHEWLTASQASRILRMTRQAVSDRIKAELIPSTEHDGRRWLRRDHVEMQAHVGDAPRGAR